MRTTQRVLLTGFEPFGGLRANSSAECALALQGSEISGMQIISCVLPCLFGEATRILIERIHEWTPTIVICLGLALDRRSITPERHAVNRIDARLPDNAGRQPSGVPVWPGGREGYASTLPEDAIVLELRQAGFPAEPSASAGTYVCNEVFYGLMRHLQDRSDRIGGFIHLPPVLGEVKGPAMNPADLIHALELAIAVTARSRQDSVRG